MIQEFGSSKISVVAPKNAKGTPEDQKHEPLKNCEAKNEDFLTLS